MTTTSTQQVQRSGENTTSESSGLNHAPLFEFHKKMDLIRAVQEKNCPNFNNVREYAKLQDKIEEGQSEPGRTPADKRVVRKLIVEQNGYGEKIQSAFDNLLKLPDVAKYAEDVIADIRKVDESLAQKLTDKQDLYHHEKYIGQIKDKHQANIISRPISQPLIPEIKPDVQPVPLAENQPRADVGDQIIAPEKLVEPSKPAEAVIEENFTENIVQPVESPKIESVEVPVAEPAPAEIDQSKQVENITTPMQPEEKVASKVHAWFDAAGAGNITSAQAAHLEKNVEDVIKDDNVALLSS